MVLGGRRPKQEGWGLFLAGVEGGAEVPLVDGNAYEPVWMPDGKRILFLSERRGNTGLWSIRVVNGTPEGVPEIVRENLAGDTQPTGVTRDGDYYYFTEVGVRDLYVAEVDPQTGRLAAAPKRISDRGLNVAPAWSPDGTSLVYYTQGSSGATGAPRIVIRSVKTGEERIASPKVPLDKPVRFEQASPAMQSDMECVVVRVVHFWAETNRNGGSLGLPVRRPLWRAQCALTSSPCLPAPES